MDADEVREELEKFKPDGDDGLSLYSTYLTFRDEEEYLNLHDIKMFYALKCLAKLSKENRELKERIEVLVRNWPKEDTQ